MPDSRDDMPGLSEAELARALSAMTSSVAVVLANLDIVSGALRRLGTMQDGQPVAAWLASHLREQTEEPMGDAREAALELASIAKRLRGSIEADAAGSEIAAQQRPRLLVVDDDRLFGRALGRSLRESTDVVVDQHGSAEQRFVAGEAFDLVVCDLGEVTGSGATGMAFYERVVRRFPRYEDRFVFVTAGPITRRVAVLLSGTGSPVLEKPFDVHVLRDLLDEQLAQDDAEPLATEADAVEAPLLAATPATPAAQPGAASAAAVQRADSLLHSLDSIAPKNLDPAFIEEYNEIVSLPPPPVAQPSTDARVVLVIDDDDAIRAMVAKVLGLTYTVFEASDGQEAAQLLEKIPHPDAIVCDVAMPRMDGLALAKRLRADPKLRRIPIIFLTARDRFEDVVEGINAGARHYLKKPVKLKELIEKVASVISVYGTSSHG